MLERGVSYATGSSAAAGRSRKIPSLPRSDCPSGHAQFALLASFARQLPHRRREPERRSRTSAMPEAGALGLGNAGALQIRSHRQLRDQDEEPPSSAAHSSSTSALSTRNGTISSSSYACSTPSASSRTPRRRPRRASRPISISVPTTASASAPRSAAPMQPWRHDPDRHRPDRRRRTAAWRDPWTPRQCRNAEYRYPDAGDLDPVRPRPV